MSIQWRVRVALSLMLLVPALLMVGAFGISRRFTGERLDPSGRLLLLSAHQRGFLSDFNRLVNENPGALADPRTLADLNQAFGGDSRWGWAVYRDGRELGRSSGAWSEREPWWESRWHRPSAAGTSPGGATTPDLRWDFRFPDGAAGTLMIYLGLPWGPPFRSPVVFILFLAVLVACNGLLAWWVSSSVVPPLARLREAAIRIGDGNLDFSLGPGRPDEMGQVTDAFETMRGKLEAAVNRQLADEASRKELIAHVSHDLRTPINLIRGYAEGIRDGVASTPEMRRRYLETILERAGELERLIELLFSYSTLDLEGVQPNLAATELAPLLQGLRDSLSKAFPTATLTLAGSTNETAPRAMLDAELTRRVMTNLVDNAVKHGGKASVAVAWSVAAGAAAGTVEVVTRDDGVGVSAEDLPRIFEPFFRGDRARTRQRGGAGAGLGLAIVRKVMQAQGGSARAAAAPGGGLEVTLTFQEAVDRGQTDPDHRG